MGNEPQGKHVFKKRGEINMMSIASQVRILTWMLAGFFGATALIAQGTGITLDREGGAVALEPYAPNILRVTISTLKDQATAGPGYGIVGKPDATGWTHETAEAGDTYKSARIAVFIAAPVPRRAGRTAPSREVRGNTSAGLAADRSWLSRAWTANLCSTC